MWRQAVAAMFDVDVSFYDPTEIFRADLRAFAMGPVLFGRSRASRQRFARDANTMARSGVDHLIVQLYTRGGFDGLADDQPIAVRQGDICVFDFGRTLATEATEFENFNLVIPHSMLDVQLGDPDALHGLVLKSGSAMTEVLARHFLALFELAPRLTIGECEAVVEGTIAMTTACLRGAVAERDSESNPSEVSLIRIRRFIDANIKSPALSADMIAREFGLSRASLYRRFDALGGVAEYIRRRRLHGAFFDLAAPALAERRINEVSRSWCFASESAFIRAFRDYHGVTPGAVRAVARLGLQRRSESSKSDAPNLTRWLIEITADHKRP
jgi:AraC-like DNA-binding protein